MLRLTAGLVCLLYVLNKLCNYHSLFCLLRRSLSINQQLSSNIALEGLLEERALEPLTLDAYLSLGLPEVVLRTVTTSVSTIARDRNDHLTVSPIGREESLEALSQFLEGRRLVNALLDHPRLHMLEVE